MFYNRSGRLMAVCGGVAVVSAAPSFASAQSAEDIGPARLVGHVYINGRTGEIITTPGPGARMGEAFWRNDDSITCGGFFYGQDRPTRDESLGRVKFGSTVMDWGDVAGPAVVNGFEFAIAGNIQSELGDVIEGFGVRVGFVDRYDSQVNPGGPVTAPGGAGPAYEIAAITLMDFWRGFDPGCSEFFCAWLITVDLEGTGLEFTLGDAAGGSGGDVDGDGLADFGYSFSFIQNQDGPKGTVGPMLARPASLGGGGTATGVVDSLSWFNSLSGPYSDYFTDLNFGGGDCPTTPYASFVMNLYGPLSVSICESIDFNGDGLIDFGDYLEFLNRFEQLDPAVDLNGDGLVDFGDWLEFYNRYGDCSI